MQVREDVLDVKSIQFIPRPNVTGCKMTPLVIEAVENNRLRKKWNHSSSLTENEEFLLTALNLLSSVEHKDYGADESESDYEQSEKSSEDSDSA